MRFFDAYNSPVQKAISFRPLHPAFHPAATGFPPLPRSHKKSLRLPQGKRRQGIKIPILKNGSCLLSHFGA